MCLRTLAHGLTTVYCRSGIAKQQGSTYITASRPSRCSSKATSGSASRCWKYILHNAQHHRYLLRHLHLRPRLTPRAPRRLQLCPRRRRLLGKRPLSRRPLLDQPDPHRKQTTHILLFLPAIPPGRSVTRFPRAKEGRHPYYNPPASARMVDHSDGVFPVRGGALPVHDVVGG